MASLDRELRAIAARGSSATVTPHALLSSVTARAARRRIANIAGASLGALAIAGLAATAALSLGHQAPPATPPDRVLGTVTLPFDPAPADAAEPANPLGLACGDPAPIPVTSAGGLEWLPRSGAGNRVDPTHFAAIRMTLRNTSGDTVPAAVSSTGYVLVHDGLVAGWTDAGWNGGVPSYRYLDSGSANVTGGSLIGVNWICPEYVAQEQLALGDYQLYPVLHVSASPADAARQWLWLAGYVVPTDDPKDLAILTPGSWDCGSGAGAAAAASGGGASPWGGPSALCAPETLAGVSINRDARTITVPYTSRLYKRSLDVTLVGEPLPYTVSTLMDPFGFLGYQGVAAAPIADASALECGARVDDGALAATGHTSAVIETGALDIHARTRFDSGTVIDLALMPGALSDPGTIAYPAPMRVWFFAHPSDYAALPLVSDAWYVVVGTATATVNRGEPLVLDRFAGPRVTSVAFTDVRWCDTGASWPTSLVMFEGTERVDDGTGMHESTVLDGWETGLDAWTTLGGGS